MPDPDTGIITNPHPPGSPEAAEWQAIRGAPSGHAGDRFMLGAFAPSQLDPGEVEEHAEHARSLSSAGVLFGPDTSEYQGKPNWTTVKASGCSFGFYKVSEGRTYQDPSHQWNRAHVPAAGLPPLGYHFLYFGQEYVDKPALWGAQAAFFASVADPHAGHALDVEAAATAGHHLGVREWVAEYRKLFPGHPLGGYLNQALWANRSRMPYDPAGLFDYVWHAGIGNGYYTTATGTIAQQWAATGKLVNSTASIGYPTVKLWQITDHASVPGVGGSFCDGNAFTGTPAELHSMISGSTQEDDTMTPEQLDQLADKVAERLAGYPSYRDKDPYHPDQPLTWARILNEVFRRSDDPVTLTAEAQSALADEIARRLSSAS